MPKVVVVTGASAGVGRATAEEFARQGYAVAMLARDPQRLEAAAAEFRSEYGVATLAIPTDVADADAVEAAADVMRRGMVVMTGASMALRFGFASLIPLGLEVDGVDEGENTLVVTARSSATAASCPLCGVVSSRVQSHYVRRPFDLPCGGRRVRLRLMVRRFRCDVPGCLREVFAERFDATVLAERARRTGRLEEIVHHLGLALGGRPGAGFAQRLMLPVSNDTLLRVVRRRALPRNEKLAVIGIDDWAYRRNHRYGTIICDLERRRVVALHPTENRRRPKHGCVSTPISASCRVTAAAAMARLSPGRCPMPFRLPIAGT